MQRLDSIKIKNETDYLSEKNLHKGDGGFLVEYISASKEWVVCILDNYNYGVYAVIRVAEKDLEPGNPATDDLKKIWEAIIAKSDFYTHTELQKPKFQEYDKVMLMVDKSKYTNKGLKKGDIGCVMSQYAVLNKWGVYFTVEGADEDIYCDVDMDDMEVVD